MQGIEVPIKDVCANLEDHESEAHNRRYMPQELNRRRGEINNCRRPQIIP